MMLWSTEKLVPSLCKKLEERNMKMILALVEPLWDCTQEQEAKRKAVLEIYDKVCGIQTAGGMPNPQLGGTKTPGGVFIHLMKEVFP